MKKKIVILGAGESGYGTAILAKKQGFKVFVSNLRRCILFVIERPPEGGGGRKFGGRG